MSLKLMYITNKTDIGILAEKCGVDRVFIDLEILGKVERQGHLDTVISRHNLDDVAKMRKVLTTSELLVRIDPMHEGSKQQIDAVIDRGADILMLPMFKTPDEVKRFIEYVGGRAKTMLLLETPQALARIEDIVSIKGIDEIHVGLNDLHLGMGLDFMFELLSGGIVEYIINKIKPTGIKYGFGGIARIGYGMLPAEKIICEHFRLKSSMVILSRSFCDAYKMSASEVEDAFQIGVKKIREFENSLQDYPDEYFIENQDDIKKIVDEIVKKKRENQNHD